MREICLEDQAAIQNACSALSLPLSEYNFSNLYLFRKKHNYKFHEINAHSPSIVGKSYDNHTFLMPLFHPSCWSDLIAHAKTLSIDYLFPISESWWPEIEQEGLSISVVEDESDYLYETEHIRICKGRHLCNHRNIVKQLLDKHTMMCQRYTIDAKDDVLSVIRAWAKEKQLLEDHADILPFKEGLQHASTLDLEGWIFYADSQPVGSLFGQALSDEIYLIHFSKALSEYRGLARYMRQCSAQQIPDQFKYLNWEQDLGIPGLRQFKHSYRPIQLLQKGRIWIDPINPA